MFYRKCVANAPFCDNRRAIFLLELDDNFPVTQLALVPVESVIVENVNHFQSPMA